MRGLIAASTGPAFSQPHTTGVSPHQNWLYCSMIAPKSGKQSITMSVTNKPIAQNCNQIRVDVRFCWPRPFRPRFFSTQLGRHWEFPSVQKRKTLVNAIPNSDWVTPKKWPQPSCWLEAIQRRTMRGPEHGARKKSKVLMGRSVCLQFMGDLLPSNDSDLMRGSRHSIHHEPRGRRVFLDTARFDDRHLERTDWVTRNFVLRRLLSGGRTWRSKREDR